MSFTTEQLSCADILQFVTSYPQSLSLYTTITPREKKNSTIFTQQKAFSYYKLRDRVFAAVRTLGMVDGVSCIREFTLLLCTKKCRFLSRVHMYIEIRTLIRRRQTCGEK